MNKITVELEIPPELDDALLSLARREEMSPEQFRHEFLQGLFARMIGLLCQERRIIEAICKLDNRTVDITLSKVLQKQAEDRERVEMLLDSLAKYQAGELTQDQAAIRAGLSRSEFLEVLNKVGDSPLQYTSTQELADATWEMDMRALSNDSENLPILPDTAFSRENLESERD